MRTPDVRPPRVFISYQRDPSSTLANLIAKALEERKIKVFLDTRRMNGTGLFPKKLQREIEACDIFICLLADTTLQSTWVNEEIKLACKLEKILIPVFQEKYEPPSEPYLDYVHSLIHSNGVLFLDKRGVYLEAAMDKLISMVTNRRYEKDIFEPQCQFSIDYYEGNPRIEVSGTNAEEVRMVSLALIEKLGLDNRWFSDFVRLNSENVQDTSDA